ncbi:hypothetical protein [Paenibacillus sp. URB8-2]|uniref:hypothetical protein n=1 Tax=Paenibacillus sp. URB8-2 TaxID=2741301 RepID=UPI0015BB0121|nr:hypothetical protein [Paenibacillus sp. URB8-2]BCG56777.1 hypothetical protein PUR_02020 [Paenibacillus sp. URB8-2]
MKNLSMLIPPALQFEVLEHDQVIAKVKLDYTKQSVEVWQDNEVSPVFLPFPGKQKVLVSDVLDFFESRCLPRTRHHIKKILQSLELSDYVPTDIVKQTHGVLYDDYVWIRFSGEELTCADVHPRFASEQGLSSDLCKQQQGRSVEMENGKLMGES